MKRRYQRRHGRPRTDNFRTSSVIDQKIHNDRVEIAKHDHDVNGVRRQIITFLSEEDIDPAIAVEALMSIAVQIYKMPPEGSKKRGVWAFIRLAWRCFRKTKLVSALGERGET